MTLRTALAASLVAAFPALLAVTPANAANSLTIDYYTIDSGDKDANHLGAGVVNNEVQNALGPHGLPVLNTAAYGCTSNCFTLAPPTDVLSTGEITYWSPSLNNGGAAGASDVTHTGSSTVTLPFNVPFNFFPPNGTGSNDGGVNGFQAATLSGTLNVPTTELISFSIGADDMAFAYLDGVVVCDLGGIHADSAGTCVTPFNIAPGLHSLEVFFVDLNVVQSGLTFDIQTQDVVSVPSVPEPETYALMAAGLGAIAAIARRRRTRA